jgi:hypothetical protein
MKKILFLFLVAAVFLFVSCRGDKGPAGEPASNVYQMMFQDGTFPYNSYSGTIDSYIDSQNATSNYGTALQINADYSGGYTQRALVKFDLTSITPSNVTVVNAYLTLAIGSSFGTAGSVAAYKLNKPWQEPYATWLLYNYMSSWATEGGDYDAAPVSDIITPATSCATFTLNNSLIQGWIANPGTNYGLMIKSQNEGTADGGLQFYSREYTEVSQRPKLTVFYKLP